MTCKIINLNARFFVTTRNVLTADSYLESNSVSSVLLPQLEATGPNALLCHVSSPAS